VRYNVPKPTAYFAKSGLRANSTGIISKPGSENSIILQGGIKLF